MFISNTLGGYSPVVLLVLLGEWMFLAFLLRKLTICMEFLDTLVTGVGLPGRAWMGMYL